LGDPSTSRKDSYPLRLPRRAFALQARLPPDHELNAKPAKKKKSKAAKA